MSDQQNIEKESGKMDSFKAVISSFFSEVGAEFHRITWPKGKELVESTVVVLAFIVMLSATVLVFDKIIEWVLKIVIGA